MSALLLGPALLIPVLGITTTPIAGSTTANSTTTTVDITGTFKVVNSTVLSTSVRDGINTTDSVTTVARNESTTQGVITGMITFESVKHVDLATGNGTSFGVGTFSGIIAERGPGACTYRIGSTLTMQGTPNASSVSTHWLTQCTGGLQGITETSTVINKANFSAVVFIDSSTPVPLTQTISPYSYVIIAAAGSLFLVSAVMLSRPKKA